MRPLFVATVFAGSFLLFLMQPLVARMALPQLGGAPAVWNSAMLVYQALLLAGYAYAHALGRLPLRRQAAVHLLLFVVAGLWLPLGLAQMAPAPSVDPAVWTPWLLVASIGPLFFAVAAQAPLMARWFASTTPGDNPYALSVASNLGSFAGLLAYPLLLEPALTLGMQRMGWSVGYAAVALLVLACATILPAAAPQSRSLGAEEGVPTRARWARWVVLAAVPSGLMLSTTAHLTTDVVAIPLLWVIPLALYLLSFTVAFASDRRPADFIRLCLPVILVPGAAAAFVYSPAAPLAAALLGLSTLFAVAVALHGEMYRLRPAPAHLTSFYLAMSVGGVLGGIFCALVAPMLFDAVYEHPILLVAAAALSRQSYLPPRMARLWAKPERAAALTRRIATAAVLVSVLGAGGVAWGLPDWTGTAASFLLSLLAFVAIGRPRLFAVCLAALMLCKGGWISLAATAEGQHRTRSYFGVYTLIERPTGGGRHELVNGTTLHGMQWQRPDLLREPTSYYGRQSGIGRALLALPALSGPQARVGVVGLGAGTLACYREPGQRWRFYEIDPAVVRIARNPAWFSFLTRCAPGVPVTTGDARLALAGEGRAGASRVDLLVIDAFTSDAVPMHLLTAEAFALYARRLAPGGLLMIHVSNRYIDLEPVLAAEAVRGGWTMRAISHMPTRAETRLGETASTWIAAGRSPAPLARLGAWNEGAGEEWRPLHARAGFEGWTDDHGSILPLLNVGRR